MRWQGREDLQCSRGLERFHLRSRNADKLVLETRFLGDLEDKRMKQGYHCGFMM